MGGGSAQCREQADVLGPAGICPRVLCHERPAEFVYKCTDYYAPEYERSILWNDPAIGIEWPVGDEAPLLSDKDKAGVSLAHGEVFE